MFDLALSVLFSSIIFVIFKLYTVYKIQTVNAIIANYITACIVGVIFYDGSIDIYSIPQESWFPGTLVLGMMFILVFNLMARTSQQLGVSVASVATKMSLVIPVLLGIWIYGEKLGSLKVVGIILALAAVYFASLKERRIELRKKSLILPGLVFLGSGIVDASIKYLEEFYVESAEFPIFSATAFGAAATSGIVFIIVQNIRDKFHFALRDILGGIALGIPNFFSIYFLLRALQTEGLNSASIFTVNNVAIVMFSTLLGIVLFKEQVTVKNWAGIGMAVISIIMVALF